MLGILHYEAFLLASLALNLTPGNDTIYILSRSLAQGRRAGIYSVLGIATGSLIHTTLAALGLSVLLAQSAFWFQAVKWTGAVYLVYLGVRMLLSRPVFQELEDRVPAAARTGEVYRQAVLTNLFNPKVALFFMAFLPQFIDPAISRPVAPFLLLGLSFTVTGTLWCLVLVYGASSIRGRLQRNAAWGLWINRVCGFVLIALGLRVGLSKA